MTEERKELLGFIFKGIGVILLVTIVGFGIRSCSQQTEGYFKTKQANIERKVFKETTTYNEAKLQELVKAWAEYNRTKDLDEKQMIASTLRHQMADFDLDRIKDEELQLFLRKVKRGDL